MKIFAPTFSISPTHRLRMATEYEMLWRTDSSDAIYAASGVPYRGTAKVSGLRVGRIIRGSIASAAYPGVGLALVAEHLSAGPVLKQADFSDSLFVGPIVNLRF